MKVEKIFTIASIVTFFALLPALIFLEVQVLRQLPDIPYLLIIFILIDILLVSFICLEIFILVSRWKKEKTKPDGVEEQEETVEIMKEWDEEQVKEISKGSKNND